MVRPHVTLGTISSMGTMATLGTPAMGDSIHLGPPPAIGDPINLRDIPCHGGASQLWEHHATLGTFSRMGTSAIVGTPPSHGDRPLPWGSPSTSGTLPLTQTPPGPRLAQPPRSFCPAAPARPVGSPPAGPAPGLTHFFQGSPEPAGATGAVRRRAGLLGGGTSLPAADHCAGPVSRDPWYPRFPRAPDAPGVCDAPGASGRCSRAGRWRRPGLGGPAGTGAGHGEVPGGATFQPGQC